MKQKASGAALTAAQAKDVHKQTLEQLKIVKAELANTQSQVKEKPSGHALKAAQAQQKQTREQLTIIEAELARTQAQVEEKEAVLKAAKELLAILMTSDG